MRPRKVKPNKVYQYAIPVCDEDPDAWFDVFVPHTSDEQDAAIDAAEALCKADPDWFPFFQGGGLITVRDPETMEEDTFLIEMHSDPEFSASIVAKGPVGEPN